ncbi:MAG: DUF3842 family protein [Oscillospiraceae bacterium]|nr:DUF3842 family protein [Oscillospiraceae bacterium]
MNILVIDGQGGQLGSQLIREIRAAYPQLELTAVGTNSAATASMLKAGAQRGATGENAVLVGCRRADVIVGPIGMVIADSLCGEVTPKMAVAIGQAEAVRILISLNQCENLVAGVPKLSMARLISDAVDRLGSLCGGEVSL